MQRLWQAVQPMHWDAIQEFNRPVAEMVQGAVLFNLLQKGYVLKTARTRDRSYPTYSVAHDARATRCNEARHGAVQWRCRN